MPFDPVPHTHLLVLAGSRSMGTHTDDSDVDVRGVVLPVGAALYGLDPFEQADDDATIARFLPHLTPDEQRISAHTKLEGSLHDLRKTIRLALDANPATLEMLWARDREVRLETPIGAELRAHRALFTTAKLRHTLGGYAAAQLKRIRTHRGWLLQPPAAPPSRADFDLPEHSLLPSDQIAAAEAAIRKQVDTWEIDGHGLDDAAKVALRAEITSTLAEIGVAAGDLWEPAARRLGLDDNLITVLDRERRYQAAHNHWRSYLSWKAHRNRARADLEASYGYDTKHAMHLVRLLRMAEEVLTDGQLHVWRGDRDADELRAIRAGAWPWEQVEAWSEAAMARVAVAPTSLPARADRAEADALVVRLTEAALKA